MSKQQLNPDTTPRIAVLGSGALGGFLGAMLARTHDNVHFLLRSEYEAVAAKGLSVHSKIHGEVHLDKVNAHRDAGTMPRCEWLLLSTKVTSNAGLGPVIGKVAANGGKLLVLQNGMHVEDQLRRIVPADVHILGGLCWVAVNRVGGGEIDHVALGSVDIGYHSGPARDELERESIVERAAQLFQGSNIEARRNANLWAARWKKLIWNAPFNGLSALLRSGTRALLSNPHSRQLVRSVMDEVAEGARLCGHKIPPETADGMLALTEAIPDYYPSMYHDAVLGREMELDAIYGVPLALVKAAGGSMPRVEALYHALRFLDEGNRSGRSPAHH